MTSAVPYFAQSTRAIRAPEKPRVARSVSVVQLLGAVGFIAGAIGGVASGLDVISTNASLDAVLLWAILAGTSAIVWTLGVIETRVLNELRKPFGR